MRIPAICSVGALLAVSPAWADGPSTLELILSKGVMTHADLYGRPVDMKVTYNADGTSTTDILGAGGRGAQVAGKWRVDGNKLCTSNAMNPAESCFDVPSDKKPGESFKVSSVLGEITLTINP